jgi:FMN phosphatase YigB (HAD superfamily)
MSNTRLIAFDLGGTLELYGGRPVYNDLQPALSEYAAQHPETSFGIATNGGLDPALRFVEQQGIGDIFFHPPTQEMLITYPGQVVSLPDTTSVKVPTNWKERISGRYTGQAERTVDRAYPLRAKPNPDMLKHLARITGVAADHAVYVGDDQYDDQMCAEAAGIAFVCCDPLSDQRPNTMAELLQQAHALLPEY